MAVASNHMQVGLRRRMYLFERAYMDFAAHVREFRRRLGRLCGRIREWFWNGPGARHMEVVLRVLVVVSGAAFGVLYVLYERNHGRNIGAGGLFAFLLIAAWVTALMWGWKAPVHIAARASSGAVAAGLVLLLGAGAVLVASLVFLVLKPA